MVENHIKESKMRIVAVSDLHGYLPNPESIPACDVVCICGDFVPLEYQNDDAASIAWFCLEFVPWTDKLSCKRVILVAGNHDFFMEHVMLGPMREDGTQKCRTASEVLKKLLPGNNKGKHKIVYLRDNSVEIDGKKFYGTPWTTGLPGWAFATTEEAFADMLKRMPKQFDVLLTHMPPTIGAVGTVLEHGWNYGRDFSSQALADAIHERDIHYVFCGHIHSGSHVLSEWKEGHFIANVSVKDERYQIQTFYFKEIEI